MQQPLRGLGDLGVRSLNRFRDGFDELDRRSKYFEQNCFTHVG